MSIFPRKWPYRHDPFRRRKSMSERVVHSYTLLRLFVQHVLDFVHSYILPTLRIVGPLSALLFLLLGVWVETAESYDTSHYVYGHAFIYKVELKAGQTSSNSASVPEAVTFGVWKHCWQYPGRYACSNQTMTYHPDFQQVISNSATGVTLDNLLPTADYAKPVLLLVATVFLAIGLLASYWVRRRPQFVWYRLASLIYSCALILLCAGYGYTIHQYNFIKTVCELQLPQTCTSVTAGWFPSMLGASIVFLVITALSLYAVSKEESFALRRKLRERAEPNEGDLSSVGSMPAKLSPRSFAANMLEKMEHMDRIPRQDFMIEELAINISTPSISFDEKRDAKQGIPRDESQLELGHSVPHLKQSSFELNNEKEKTPSVLSGSTARDSPPYTFAAAIVPQRSLSEPRRKPIPPSHEYEKRRSKHWEESQVKHAGLARHQSCIARVGSDGNFDKDDVGIKDRDHHEIQLLKAQHHRYSTIQRSSMSPRMLRYTNHRESSIVESDLLTPPTLAILRDYDDHRSSQSSWSHSISSSPIQIHSVPVQRATRFSSHGTQKRSSIHPHRLSINENRKSRPLSTQSISIGGLLYPYPTARPSSTSLPPQAPTPVHSSKGLNRQSMSPGTSPYGSPRWGRKSSLESPILTGHAEEAEEA